MTPRAAPSRWILAILAALGATSCGSLPRAQTCGEIPEGGCPAGRGGSCDDTACRALYDCVEGDWTVEVTCGDPGPTGGGGGPGGGDPGSAGAGGACEPPSVDRTGEAEGCTPDLQEPDCPVDALEVCPDPCTTGCADFFLCTGDGWVDVAACDEDGVLVILRP